MVVYVPAPVTWIVTIDNVAGTSSVSDAFAGMAVGAMVVISGYPSEISYVGGTDSNDVVLIFDTTPVVMIPMCCVDNDIIPLIVAEHRSDCGPVNWPFSVLTSAVLEPTTTAAAATICPRSTSPTATRSGWRRPAECGTQSNLTGDRLTITGNGTAFTSQTFNFTDLDANGNNGLVVLNDGTDIRMITFLGLNRSM